MTKDIHQSLTDEWVMQFEDDSTDQDVKDKKRVSSPSLWLRCICSAQNHNINVIVMLNSLETDQNIISYKFDHYN